MVSKFNLSKLAGQNSNNLVIGGPLLMLGEDSCRNICNPEDPSVI